MFCPSGLPHYLWSEPGPEHVSVVVNNPVSLTCDIPLPAITWLNDGNTTEQETAADTSTSMYWVGGQLLSQYILFTYVSFIYTAIKKYH